MFVPLVSTVQPASIEEEEHTLVTAIPGLPEKIVISVCVNKDSLDILVI